MDSGYSAQNTGISRLEQKHEGLIAHFNSSESGQNDFIANDALEYAKLNLGITYLLFRTSDSKLVAFITLGMGAIRLNDKSGWELHGRRLKDYPKHFPNHLPALKIGQLATVSDEEGKGAGTLLLKFAGSLASELKTQVGCAYLVLDAKPARFEWYSKRGFKTWIGKSIGMETIPMYLELQ